ncbi:MAG: N-formylglutamate amidohydrolase [Rudaea sp.]
MRNPLSKESTPIVDDTVKPSLLAPDEPPAFSVARAEATAPFLLICDHAGRNIPRALGDLGVPADQLQRHIAWDIGALGVAAHLSRLLDACLIAQTYSRLVIDCNRPPAASASIVTRSERTDVPGNRGLTPAAAAARVREIFAPYHARIAAELDRRQAAKLPTILVSVHSFTPEFMDAARVWHLGMLYNRDARVAHALLAMIRSEGQWIVGDNEPYAVSDATDYAIPVHGEARGLPHIELEIRQDLIADGQGQAEWAARVAMWLERVPAILGM